MARYNVKNISVVENGKNKMWQFVTEDGQKYRGLGKQLFIFSTKAKKYRAVESNMVLSVNRLVAYMQIEKNIGKLQTVKSLEGKQLKMAEAEHGHRGRKHLSFYGI